MKKLIYMLLMAVVVAGISSCEKDEVRAVKKSNPIAPDLKNPSAPGGLTFSKEDADKSIDFAWTASDFGFPASVTYGVQLSSTSDFSETSTILNTQDLDGSVKISDLNGTLLALDLPAGETATVHCRVFAMVSSRTDSAFSAVREYSVVPYETVIDYPIIYVPGAYQGWAPGAENGRLYSYEFNSVYEGIIRLDGGDPVAFKITPAANWDNAWGGTLTASGSNYSGTLDPSGGDYSAKAGTYEFKVDVSALTIELTKTNDWGIIGSSVPPYDWSVDVNMSYNGQRKVWEATGDFKAGEFKFRANDGWDLNFGDSGADGSLDAGGDNIQLPSDGNYTIQLDIEKNTYTVTKN